MSRSRFHLSISGLFDTNVLFATPMSDASSRPTLFLPKM